MTGHFRTMLTNQSVVSAIARLMAQAGSSAAEGSVPLCLGMALEAVMVAGCAGWFVLSASSPEEPASDRFALAALFALMAGFSPISWKSYYAAMVVSYMLLTGELIEDRQQSLAAWGLWIVAVLLNFAPGRYLNRIAMFYSLHFISSLLTIAAIGILWIARDRESMESRQFSA